MRKRAARTRCRAAFKTELGLEAVIGVRSVARFAREYSAHPVRVSQWKAVIRCRLPELCRLRSHHSASWSATVEFLRASATASPTHRANGRCSSRGFHAISGPSHDAAVEGIHRFWKQFPHQPRRATPPRSLSVNCQRYRSDPIGFSSDPVDSPRGEGGAKAGGADPSTPNAGPGAGPQGGCGPETPAGGRADDRPVHSVSAKWNPL